MKYLLLTIITITCTTWLPAHPTDSTSHKVTTKPHHQFATTHAGATLEAIRDAGTVKIYMLVEDIEQYEQLAIERSDESMTNFTQIKSIPITPGKYPDNYLEVEDRFPVSAQMAITYRIKAMTPDGITKMFAPVAITHPQAKGKK